MATPDELRADREKAERALPYMIDGLVLRKEPAEIAAAVAAEHAVSEVSAFAWVTVVEERFLASRKRVAIAGNSVLGPGVAAFVAGLLLALLSRHAGAGIALTAIGGFATGAASVTLFGSRRIAGNLVLRRMSTE